MLKNSIFLYLLVSCSLSLNACPRHEQIVYVGLVVSAGTFATGALRAYTHGVDEVAWVSMSTSVFSGLALAWYQTKTLVNNR